jgi:hypothetical protein
VKLGDRVKRGSYLPWVLAAIYLMVCTVSLHLPYPYKYLPSLGTNTLTLPLQALGLAHSASRYTHKRPMYVHTRMQGCRYVQRKACLSL